MVCTLPQTDSTVMRCLAFERSRTLTKLLPNTKTDSCHNRAIRISPTRRKTNQGLPRLEQRRRALEVAHRPNDP